MAELTLDKKQHAFAGWPMIIFWVGAAVFTLHACTSMVAAGDTWVAMACGRHFANHGISTDVVTTDPFSANSHEPALTAAETQTEIRKWPGWAQKIAGMFDEDTVRKWHPTGWVNQNWLTHVTYYRLAKMFGTDGEYNYNMLVLWKFAIYIVAGFCIYKYSRLIGTGGAMAAAATACAMFVGRSFFDIRPANYANMLVAIYILILALTTYRNILYIWLIVPLTVFWGNVHGGYIYVFMILVPFVGLNLLTSLSKERFASIGLKGIYHTIGAGFAAFVAMVLFNPYHLTNLTHTFIISFSEHAESWRRVAEWRSAFDWENRVGTGKPFLVMYIIIWVSIVPWLVVRLFKPRLETKRREEAEAIADRLRDVWPKIDVVVIVIATLSVYMAVKSRRFIPIASFTACPVIAMFIEHSIRMIAVRRNFNRTGELAIPAMPLMVRNVIVSITGVFIVCFSGWFALKFQKMYFAPWPSDTERTSVFMRMTASYMKPFDVCQFISDNNVSGNMFNYWTEGGALAFGQEPDPETGVTPLQLFMDGRAQAAYDHDKYQLWRALYVGGPIAGNIQWAKRKATKKELGRIAEWLDIEMAKRDIWVFVLPSSSFAPKGRPQEQEYFPSAMAQNSRWRLAYMDEHQQMYVNVKTEKGKQLMTDVLNGQAKFPNEFSRNLTLGRNYLMITGTAASGFEHVKKAFAERPCEVTIIQVIEAGIRHQTFMTQTRKIIEAYVEDFEAQKDVYRNEAGYARRLRAAFIAARQFESMYARVNPETAKKYKAMADEYLAQWLKIKMNWKW